MTTYTLKLEIHYTFDRPTGAGRQQFRILPADLPGRQRLLASTLRLAPQPVEQRRFGDFFGTGVIEAAIPAGLSRFDLALTARVDRPGQQIGADLSPPPAGLATEIAAVHSIAPDAPHHFLPASRRIPPVAEISDFAHEVTRGSQSVREMIERLGLALHDHMTFDSQATMVDTPPAEAFAAGRGVCQDFAQIMVGGLRSLGVPAAYVAGYLRTLPPPGKPRLVGADAMHAWVRAWAGTGTGWIDHDPTNACFAGADHIDVGFGRDYGDVAPVTGMLRLDGSQSGRHSVDIVADPE